MSKVFKNWNQKWNTLLKPSNCKYQGTIIKIMPDHACNFQVGWVIQKPQQAMMNTRHGGKASHYKTDRIVFVPVGTPKILTSTKPSGSFIAKFVFLLNQYGLLITKPSTQVWKSSLILEEILENVPYASRNSSRGSKLTDNEWWLPAHWWSRPSWEHDLNLAALLINDQMKKLRTIV